MKPNGHFKFRKNRKNQINWIVSAEIVINRKLKISAFRFFVVKLFLSSSYVCDRRCDKRSKK